MNTISRIKEFFRLLLAIFCIISSIVILLMLVANHILTVFGTIPCFPIKDTFTVFIIILSCISNIVFGAYYLKKEEVGEEDDPYI